jgi:DNA topoisomerase-1
MKQPETGASTTADAKEAAAAVGLVYVTDEEPGIARQPAGKGFRYLRPSGEPVRDVATLERIRRLAVPPAWTGVWICAKANGHLQATGRDARGRKQYKYHAQFRELREETKYEHLREFAQALPRIRARIAEHMALRGLPREKVLGTVVHLLETTLIRVGNEDYARTNQSYGLTTLRNPHVKVEGPELRFHFKGKGGKTWRLQMRDRRIARIIKSCQELPGQDLFQYQDETGEVRPVTSADVNAYLREVSGMDITAKDFRTWAGTVLAALALRDCGPAGTQVEHKKNVRAAIERVAARLGNTVTICRKCYVHPEVLAAYAQGALLLESEEATQELHPDVLKPEEQAVLRLLEARQAGTLEDQLRGSLAARKRA